MADVPKITASGLFENNISVKPKHVFLDLKNLSKDVFLLIFP